MSGNFSRGSRDLKLIFDNLDKRDDGDDDAEDPEQAKEVAMEAEAIKMEVAASRADTKQPMDTVKAQKQHEPQKTHESQKATSAQDTSSVSSDMLVASTSSLPSVSSDGEMKNSPSKDSQILERKRGGSLLRRAKRALGISYEADNTMPTDRPSSVFNTCSADEAINRLIAEGFLGTDPSSIAEFFHTNASLNKFKIGKYIGSLHDFNIKVLHELVRRLDFSSLDFDIALRHLLYCFRLPAEAQQINRIMDAFGSHYFNTCTNSVFVNADAAQIMAFSCIMLTTDAHNPRVIEKMTKQQFVTLTRGMNGDGNFPKDFLEYMYEKVVDEPLIRIDHTTTMFPYATKRGWVYLPKKKLWKRYYGVLFEGSLYLQHKPMETKWRKRINGIKLLTPELLSIFTTYCDIWC